MSNQTTMHRQSGMVSIYIVILMALVTMLSLAFIQIVNNSYLAVEKSMKNEDANYIAESGLLTLHKLIKVMKDKSIPITDAEIMSVACQLNGLTYNSTAKACSTGLASPKLSFSQGSGDFSVNYNAQTSVIKFISKGTNGNQERNLSIQFSKKVTAATSGSCSPTNKDTCIIVTTASSAPVTKFDRTTSTGTFQQVVDGDVFANYSQLTMDADIDAVFTSEGFATPPPTPTTTYTTPVCSNNNTTINSNDLTTQATYNGTICSKYVDVNTGRLDINGNLYASNQLSLRGNSFGNGTTYMIKVNGEMVVNNFWIYDLNQYYNCANYVCNGEHGLEIANNFVLTSGGSTFLASNKFTSFKVGGDMIVKGDLVIDHSFDNALEIGGDLIVTGNLTINKSFGGGGTSKGLWVGGSIKVGGNITINDKIGYMRVGYRGSSGDGYIKCGGTFTSNHLYSNPPSAWKDVVTNLPITDMSYITRDLIANNILVNGDIFLNVRGGIYSNSNISINSINTVGKLIVGKSMLAKGNISLGKQISGLEVANYLMAKGTVTVAPMTYTTQSSSYGRVNKILAGGRGVSFSSSTQSYALDTSTNKYNGLSFERIWSGGTSALTSAYPNRGVLLFGDSTTNSSVTTTTSTSSSTNEWSTIDFSAN